MLRLILGMALSFSLTSCRKDGDDAEQELKWSCARLYKNSAPLVSPECLQELQRDDSKVLKYYRPVAQMDGRKVVSYILVAKKPNDSSKVAR